MMRILLFLVFLSVSFSCFLQQNFLPIHSFYKDQLFNSENNKGIPSSYLPRSEGDIDLHHIIRDSSVQYYMITQKLLKEHLLQIKGDGYYFTVSPTVDISGGTDLIDTSGRRFYNNTRGFFMELDIFDKLSFSSSFYENQNRFLDYQTHYFKSVGERYITADSTYQPQNAVVPGSARTKPFKGDGFDYAYAFGNVVYAPNKNMRFSMGNNHQFVGYGHRSLFYSDNSVPTTYLRADFKFLKQFEYTVLRAKSFNLLRRPFRTTVEAYYEPKPFSSHYLSWNIHPKIRLSVFEGTYWNVGDSIRSHDIAKGFYFPLPLASSTRYGTFSNGLHSIHGYEAAIQLKKTLLYGQIAMHGWDFNQMAIQLGTRAYDLFSVSESMLQLEVNYVPKNVYESKNKRLSYSHYNLPSAHIKGSSFTEYILRYNKSYKRFYGDLKTVVYSLRNYQSGSLIVNYDLPPKESGSITMIQTELGYRFNKKVNLTGFVRHVYRNSSMSNDVTATNAFYIGISTNLINHYKDF